MVIRVLDIVERCYSDMDGQKVYRAIFDCISKNEPVTISFDGVDVVPSSFVNSAFIPLLDDFSFETVKDNLSFIDSSPQINEMIKSRFLFEVARRS